MLVLVRCFSCTPGANSSKVFLLPHASFDDTFNKVFLLVTLLSDANFSEEFPLHS